MMNIHIYLKGSWSRLFSKAEKRALVSIALAEGMKFKCSRASLIGPLRATVSLHRDQRLARAQYSGMPKASTGKKI